MSDYEDGQKFLKFVNRLLERRCPQCGSLSIVWYSAGFGTSWNKAEYERCACSSSVINPVNPDEVVKRLIQIIEEE